MSSTHSNTFPSLCLGPDTTTPAQPDNPSGAVMRARRRTLFGAELPSSAVGNGFADMYSADGMTLTVRSLADLQRVAGATNMPLDLGDEIQYPQTVELNFPWCIGAPGQQRDAHFIQALTLQLSTTLSTSRVFHPGDDDLDACDFTRFCRRGTTEYHVAYAEQRARRGMATMPIFRHPKIWMVPLKQEHVLDNGNTKQNWYTWQVCTNCVAVRAKAWCSIWQTAAKQQDPKWTKTVEPGQKSALDDYAWFADFCDPFLGKDIGYYGEWV